jgi:hypothetical protein
MKNKIAAHFRPSRASAHSYQRLKQCKSCGNYSSLWIDRCLRCGAERRFLELPALVRTILRHRAQKEGLLIGAAALAALFLARSMTEMAVSVLAGIAIIAAYYLLRRHYYPYLEKRTLHDLLVRDNRAIRDGLLLDIEDAAENMKTADYKLAYEKLREIGHLISGNQVNVLKIMCLNHFILRKDMELELSTLLPDVFDPDFIHYLYEVSKVSPDLIKRDVIEYAVRYREEMEALPGGKTVLAQVAAAALRVKAYVVQFQDVIADYIDELPRDRLLRLCRITAEAPDKFPVLFSKARETVKLKYNFDPEFQGLY